MKRRIDIRTSSWRVRRRISYDFATAMARVPRGVKGLLLVWLVFSPYIVWYSTRFEMGLSPGLVPFLSSVVVGSVVFAALWTKWGRSIPSDKQNVNYIPWIFGLALAWIGVFGAEDYVADAWRATSSRQFVEQQLPQLLATPSDSDQYRLRSSQELKHLGSLLGYDDLHGRAQIAHTPHGPNGLEAQYIARGRFEHGNADISLRLVRPDSERGWQINAVSVAVHPARRD